jgi:hypothetical protein
LVAVVKVYFWRYHIEDGIACPPRFALAIAYRVISTGDANRRD